MLWRPASATMLTTGLSVRRFAVASAGSCMLWRSASTALLATWLSVLRFAVLTTGSCMMRGAIGSIAMLTVGLSVGRLAVATS